VTGKEKRIKKGALSGRTKEKDTLGYGEKKRVKFNTTIIFTSKRLQILCRIFRDLDFLVPL
jgi:hypothetical protein